MHVIATAGHVDHGKSTLIRALTGMEPDRWAEERRRGMTIDLGYAWTTLADGTRLAFVDVPGHRRFLTSMLAGVGPVPAALLVIASDAGWSQQTGEHVRALDALGVRHGVLALTRADLGDADLAEQEARDHLAGTSLANVEAVAVSPVTGLGLDTLRTALARLAASLPAPPPWPARLWVDRSFGVRGAGTVVTGTLATGGIDAGDELQVVPSGRRVRVRSVQTLGTEVPRADAVARVALNLRGVDPEDVPRGCALVPHGHWTRTDSMDVHLDVPSGTLPEQPLLHVGSAAVPVRLRPLGDAFARLTLAHPVPVRRGDRALLRDPGQVAAIAGVTVLDPLPPQLRRRGAARARATDLAALLRGDGATELRVRGAARLAELVRAGTLDAAPPGSVRAGAWLVDADVWHRWSAELGAAVRRREAEAPLRPGIARSALAEQLHLPDVELVDPLVAADPDLVSDADGVHRAGSRPTLTPTARRALDGLLERLTAEPFAAPEAPELVGAGLEEEVLGVAVRQGELLRVGAGVYLRPGAVDEAVRRLAALPQPFTASQARAALGTTRRVALPLLEHLDRARRTRRIDAQSRTVTT